jgi:hypothetical protein
MTFLCQIRTFHLYVATFEQHLHMEYIYISVDTIFYIDRYGIYVSQMTMDIFHL